jgi:glycosyltransferase involved in cell wall biosynthesis
MNGPLHIVLCTDGIFPHAMGGMQRHSRLLAEHLARSGKVRLTVIHPHDAVVFDPVLGIREVHVAPIDPDRFYLRELWHYSARVAQQLDRLKPDAILAQGFTLWKGMERFSDRSIVHPHGLEMFQGLSLKDQLLGLPFRFALRSIVRRSARVVSLGGKLTTILEGLVRGSDTRVVVLPNAVDLPGTNVLYPAVDGPLRLLFVGRFAFNKGLDVIMSVAERLAGEGLAGKVRFELAGDGPLLEHYGSAGLPENVLLLGRVDDDRLFELYSECHALLLPTRFEGMPTVVLEAMARARPILVSDVGATAELVDPSNGFLLPPGDVDALHGAILDLLEMSSNERAQMGERSLDRVRQKFTWPLVTEGFLALFEALSTNTTQSDTK